MASPLEGTFVGRAMVYSVLSACSWTSQTALFILAISGAAAMSQATACLAIIILGAADPKRDPPALLLKRDNIKGGISRQLTKLVPVEEGGRERPRRFPIRGHLLPDRAEPSKG